MAAEISHPRIFTTPEELKIIRTEIATMKWKHDLYSKGEPGMGWFGGGAFKANADHWLNEDIEIPGRGGHFHLFFCDDGTQLQFPSDGKPHPEEGYRCPSCDKVYKGEKYDAAVSWKLHNQLAVAAFDLALTWQIERDRRYADKCAQLLVKYAKAYPGPHTDHITGGIIMQALCESVWTIPIASAYDLALDSGAFAEEDVQLINEKMLRPLANGITGVGHMDGNHGSWHIACVGIVGFILKDQSLIDWAMEHFRIQMNGILGADGLWPESIHCYHFYPLSAFIYFAEAALRNGYDLYNWKTDDGKDLKSMFTAPLQYMYPDFSLAAINNGWFGMDLPQNLYEVAWHRYKDPDFAWTIREGNRIKRQSRGGVWALLLGRPLPSTIPSPEFRSHNFFNLGIATIRNQDTMMTFDYGRHLIHGQPDKMGVTLYSHVQLFAADYGTPGYGSSIMSYYQSTAAHNTIVVDGVTQQLTSRGGLSTWFTSPRFDAASSTTDETNPGTSFSRSVLRVDDLFIIVDELQGGQVHTWDFIFRSEGSFSCNSTGVTAENFEEYPHFQSQSKSSAEAGWCAAWKQRNATLTMVSLDGGGDLITVKTPAETGARLVDGIIHRKKGPEARFVTLLRASNDNSVLNAVLEGGIISATIDNRRFTIAISPEAANKMSGSDAPFAVTIEEDGILQLAIDSSGCTLPQNTDGLANS